MTQVTVDLTDEQRRAWRRKRWIDVVGVIS